MTMCGIAGKIYTSADYGNVWEIQQMLDAINHRGPDDFGTYCDGRVVLGQKRLSIVDLSADGKQPMSYRDRYQVVFNGEIYNYIELREELRKKGYQFHTKTDTEVLLASYDCWNTDCLNHFNGMWSFAILDLHANQIFCARDRFGVKPFYYYQTEDGFAFASEIKEFTVLRNWAAIGNIPRIIDFILNNGMHDYCNETLFEGVYQLRPGEMLIYNLNTDKYDIKTWYHLADKKHQSDMSMEEAAREFAALFTDAVNLRLRSDVKVGSCLSGGLDSSAIVCTMNQLLTERDQASQQEVVFAENHVGKYDESAYADAVVEKTGVIRHSVQPSYDEIITKLDEIVWHQDEPFGSTSIIAQWDVYEKARENGLTVMLDGQGADEYLAGYSSFHKVYFRELLLSFKFKKLHTSLATYKQLYHDYYYPPYRDLVDIIFSRFISEQKVEAFKTKVKHMMGKAVRTDYIYNYDNQTDHLYSKYRKMSTSITDETIAEMMHISLPKLVHHQDRNAMAHSIESRAPFLDYRLVEFVFNLPSDYKVNLGVTKYVMREGLKDVLPDVIKNRMDKLGFATPEDVWIRDNQESFCKLLDSACDVLHGIVVKEKVMSEFKRQVKEKGKLDSIFWCIVCTSAWVNRFHVSL